jgi:hypothetical protein
MVVPSDSRHLRSSRSIRGKAIGRRKLLAAPKLGTFWAVRPGLIDATESTLALESSATQYFPGHMISHDTKILSIMLASRRCGAISARKRRHSVAQMP